MRTRALIAVAILVALAAMLAGWTWDEDGASLIVGAIVNAGSLIIA